MSHYGLTLTAGTRYRGPTRCRGGGAPGVRRNVPSTNCCEKLAPGALYVDVKCQADAAALRERGREGLAAVKTHACQPRATENVTPQGRNRRPAIVADERVVLRLF